MRPLVTHHEDGSAVGVAVPAVVVDGVAATTAVGAAGAGAAVPHTEPTATVDAVRTAGHRRMTGLLAWELAAVATTYP
jgi:hypothetical protein